MKKFIIILIIALGVIGIGIEVVGPLVNERTDSYVINDIVKVENVHGSEDGFSTNIYHLIYTDQGVLSVQMNGFNAHPEVMSKLHVSDTVTLRTRGLYFPYLEMYPNVIKVFE
jgi:hypothetical protein